MTESKDSDRSVDVDKNEAVDLKRRAALKKIAGLGATSGAVSAVTILTATRAKACSIHHGIC